MLIRLALLTLVCFMVAASAAAADEQSDRVTDALRAALTKNIDHARRWLDERDYKSLAQSAGGLQLLA